MGKIAVLGLGPSLKLFKGGLSIGVNDIWSSYPADYVVCLDEKNRFTPERLKVIEECRPVKFFSQLNCWSSHPAYEKIELQHDYPNYECYLDLETIPKSLCSPFVAAAIAYKMWADEINIYGVDLLNHPLLKESQVKKIKQHFENLQTALIQKGKRLIIHGDGVLKYLNK